MKQKDQAKVYYIPLVDQYSKEKSLFSLECTLTLRVFRLLDIFIENDVVGIKINDTDHRDAHRIHHQYYNLISTLLAKRNISPILCDTSRKFKDRKTNASKHMQEIFEADISYFNTRTPLLMLDGINGKHELLVKTNKGVEKENVYLAGELNNLDGLIVTSFAIPDDFGGFKGALYNLGFSLASSKGKIRLSTMNHPQINSTKCYYCRKCLHECPTKAIYVKDRHVEIDSSQCIDCGKCVEIARYGGITYHWNATADYFQKNLIRYANTILNLLKNKMLFINFLPDLSEGANSYSGILLSKDPYAIDLETSKRVSGKAGISFLFNNSEYDNYKLEIISY